MRVLKATIAIPDIALTPECLYHCVHVGEKIPDNLRRDAIGRWIDEPWVLRELRQVQGHEWSHASLDATMVVIFTSNRPRWTRRVTLTHSHKHCGEA